MGLGMYHASGARHERLPTMNARPKRPMHKKVSTSNKGNFKNFNKSLVNTKT